MKRAPPEVLFNVISVFKSSIPPFILPFTEKEVGIEIFSGKVFLGATERISLREDCS